MRTGARRSLLAAVALVSLGLVLPSTASSPLGLHVSGNRILDGHQRPVVLNGVNRAGTEGGPDTSSVPVTDTELGWMGSDHPGSWHASAVRVAVGEAQWTGGCPNLASNPATYQRMLDAEVRGITRRGMVALVDLHTVTAGCTSIGRHAMPDALAVTFWRSAARHWGSNPLVAFELYNEPHFVSQAVWRHGGTVQDCDLAGPALTRKLCQLSSPRYQAVGMQQLYDVVHAAAPNHLIVADGLDYATTPPTSRLRGPAVYAVHPYTCPGPGACQSPANAHVNTTVLARWLALARTAPIWVTEFGWPAQGGVRQVNGAAYYAQTIAWLQARQPSWGWLAFAFDGSSSGAFALASSTATYAPTPTGTPVWRALRRLH